ncbi:MAG: hypothetical protein D6815_12000 [Candidatus Dadabacteria bacterium]|nr:MAG: hypothetical protein D6815_12000 [Candidatus Dadabacteria bacterium]
MRSFAHHECFAACLVALTLAGCDFFYGVSRVASLEQTLPATCVESAIRSVPTVSEVRHERRSGSRPLTLTGIQDPDRLDYFYYKTSKAGATLLIRTDYKGRVELSQHLIHINRKPPQEDIDAIRPVMLEIELALERLCEIAGLSESIEEYCLGVECPEPQALR